MQTTKDATPSLEDEASVIQEKYETLLTLFSQCHSKYNFSAAVEDAEIDVLGTTPTLSNYVSVMHEFFFFFFLTHIYELFFTLSTEQDIEEFVTFFRSNFETLQGY